jgi:hypothetical protein
MINRLIEGHFPEELNEFERMSNHALDWLSGIQRLKKANARSVEMYCLWRGSHPVGLEMARSANRSVYSLGRRDVKLQGR